MQEIEVKDFVLHTTSNTIYQIVSMEKSMVSLDSNIVRTTYGGIKLEHITSFKLGHIRSNFSRFKVATIRTFRSTNIEKLSKLDLNKREFK